MDQQYEGSITYLCNIFFVLYHRYNMSSPISVPSLKESSKGFEASFDLSKSQHVKEFNDWANDDKVRKYRSKEREVHDRVLLFHQKLINIHKMQLVIDLCDLELKMSAGGYVVKKEDIKAISDAHKSLQDMESLCQNNDLSSLLMAKIMQKEGGAVNRFD